jgi:hypothetical protein
MVWVFNPIFVSNLEQALGDNSWLVEPINRNYKTHLLRQTKYLLGTNEEDNIH